MKISNEITKMLHLKYPIVMAPLFLVSNESMLHSAMDAGILGCFPSLNYRKEHELEAVLTGLNTKLDKLRQENLPGNYGVNLIVQRTNSYFKKHLAACVRNKVPVYITSLGNPEETIQAAHAYGGKVFCDVTNLQHAEKCYRLGCDGFIAVGYGAGGHAGNNPLMLLVETLKRNFPNTPVLAAGGIATGKSMLSALAAGASAAYIGTRFIASTECSVVQSYKDAILASGMGDIVMTDRLSGTPCSIINTPYVKKIGTHQNFIERWLSKNSRTKKYFKTLVQLRGFKQLEEAIKPGNYHTLWCAGQSVEMIDSIKPVKEIVSELVSETKSAFDDLSQSISSLES